MDEGSTMDGGSEPYLEVGEVTVTDRDVELLRGVADHGSIHRAATELGRSYARMQRRIVELEESLGPLVERRRGGAGGGGSSLTDDARRLLERFDRLSAALDGLTEAEESVLSGTVRDRDGEVATVETGAGRIRAIVPPDATEVRVGVRSDAITLTTPSDTPVPTATSARNRFEGVVTDVDRGDGVAHVSVDVGVEDPIRVFVTATSLSKLDLEPGDGVVASFKATATRAVSVE